MKNKEITFLSDLLEHSPLSTKKKTLESFLLNPLTELMTWDLVEEKYSTKIPTKVIDTYEEYVDEYGECYKTLHREENAIYNGYNNLQSVWGGGMGLSGFVGAGTVGFVALGILGISGIALTIGVFGPAIIGGHYGQQLGTEIGTAHALNLLKQQKIAKLVNINQEYALRLLDPEEKGLVKII